MTPFHIHIYSLYQDTSLVMARKNHRAGNKQRARKQRQNLPVIDESKPLATKENILSTSSSVDIVKNDVPCITSRAPSPLPGPSADHLNKSEKEQTLKTIAKTLVSQGPSSFKIPDYIPSRVRTRPNKPYASIKIIPIITL